jgi:non-ribosomal peptide synthetase component F
MLLSAALTDPSLRVAQLPLLGATERDELLALGKGEPTRYSDQPLHASLAQIARDTPDAVAVVCREVELTYANSTGEPIDSLGTCARSDWAATRSSPR